MAFLVDTNILVYRFDLRFPDKQAEARALLRTGLAESTARIPHQALLEFVSVVTRVRAGSKPLLAPDEARRETEELMLQFPVLFPNAALLRTALRARPPISFPGSTRISGPTLNTTDWKRSCLRISNTAVSMAAFGFGIPSAAVESIIFLDPRWTGEGARRHTAPVPTGNQSTRRGMA